MSSLCSCTKNLVHSLQIPLWDVQYYIFIITSQSCDCCPLLFSLAYPILFPEIASASHLTAPSCVPLLLPYYISCPCSVFLSLRCKMWLEMWQHIKCTCGSTTNLSQIISEGLRTGSFPLRMGLLPCLMRAHLGIPDSLVRLAVVWQHEQNRATLSSWAVKEALVGKPNLLNCSTSHLGRSWKMDLSVSRRSPILHIAVPKDFQQQVFSLNYSMNWGQMYFCHCCYKLFTSPDSELYYHPRSFSALLSM